MTWLLLTPQTLFQRLSGATGWLASTSPSCVLPALGCAQNPAASYSRRLHVTLRLTVTPCAAGLTQ